MDILVTTPKGQMENAAKEAENVKKDGGGQYFRYIGRNKPNNIQVGDKIFYVEDGYIRGFCTIQSFTRSPERTCSTTGIRWQVGWYIFMDATTWWWIKPIKHKGFQGWRYLNDIYREQSKIVVGSWLDPKPAAK